VRIKRMQEPGRLDDWKLSGLCAQVDPQLFYPDRGDSAAVTQAKTICGRCEVQATCLEWALSRREDFGVWGGTAEQERHALRRSMKS
jgi:WhiB family redox-sensing transcriptional regulator